MVLTTLAKSSLDPKLKSTFSESNENFNDGNHLINAKENTDTKSEKSMVWYINA